jgi:hypothetical protein
MRISNCDIPRGDTPEEIKQRTDLIWKFYQEWKRDNPTQRVYNNKLKDYINVRQISIDETARHAAKKYLSTLAVLQLDAILACARLIKTVKPENRANQKQFKAMLVMQYDCQGLGRVKLLVGIRHKTMLKIQYCITALEVE